MSGVAPTRSLRSGSRVLEAVLRTSRTQRRWLSSTQCRASQKVISFDDASPTLKPLLNRVRESIILPEYLPREQRERIYRPKYKPILERDPFVLEIDGELHKFYYRDKMNLPNTDAAVKEIVDAMKTASDFHILPLLLEGVCVQAGRKLDPAIFVKVIRRAAQADALQMIIDCIQRAKSTGFKLDHHEATAQLFTLIQDYARKHGWTQKSMETALRWSQTVLDLLEGDEAHKPVRRPNTDPVDLGFPNYRDPQFLAARLHLLAAHAVKHNKGTDTGNVVWKYATQLVSLWPEEKGLLDLRPDAAFDRKDGARYLLDRNIYLWHAAPIYSGLKLAEVVLGRNSLAQQLAGRAEAVEKEMKVALAVAKEGRGVQAHRDYVEAKPWEGA